MHLRSASFLLGAAVLLSALGAFAGPILAEEQVKGSEVPTNSYYGDTLSNSERQGIAEEEDVSPNDGKASVPAPQDQAIIPDAADPEKGDTFVNAPADGALPGDVDTKDSKTTESEADVILQDSKKDFRVTRNEYDKCLSQWDAQTQMTKEQWAESCRSTLQYFPEGGN